eukprot:TRINITY_DN20882_c2_g1_i2.p1 TRINITY_DN20882_c2_g1~~TRINITY_DN20882_c2_g1_i2.p1  ORF type:complete len:128 (-),score=25.84 TRINITY_DN20882_c2_g1_i2:66-449(-)
MVNLLHFANNALIFCGAEVKQIVNVKTILICFEAVSGLKVNLFKSEIPRVQLSDFQLEEFADVMGCKAGSFLTSNLGLLLCLGSAFKGREKNKKFHLLNWNKLIRPKREGGVGSRPLRKMNEALLGK